MSKAGNFLIQLFLYISIALPAGTIFNINVKILSLLMLLAYFFMYKKGVGIVRMVAFLAPTIVCVLFLISYCYLISSNPLYAMSQSKDIIVFVLVASIAYAFVDKGNYEANIVRPIINVLTFIAGCKLLILLIAFVKGLPVSAVVQSISDFFNIMIMTLDVDNTALARINFPSDSILPIAVFYLASIIFSGKATRKDYIITSLILFSLLISMSRYQWAASAVSVFLSMLIYFRKKKALMSFAAILIAAFGAFSIPSVNALIMERFDTKQTSFSDGVRDIQQAAIYRQIDQSPLMGHGIGYFIPTLVRSHDVPYAYELQAPALVMQVGIIGTVMLIAVLFVPLLYAARRLGFLSGFCYIMVGVFWIGASFFNPALFSSSGGAALLLMYCLPEAKSLSPKKVIS